MDRQNSSGTTAASHQAMMKCPWQWRQPFLDAKKESRKRQAGDGCFYDALDPDYVDHLVPIFPRVDTSPTDEKEKIQQEIKRLMNKQHKELKKQEEEVVVAFEDIVGPLNIFTSSANYTLATKKKKQKPLYASKSMDEQMFAATISTKQQQHEDAENDRTLINHNRNTPLSCGGSLNLMTDNLNEAFYFATEELLEFDEQLLSKERANSL